MNGILVSEWLKMRSVRSTRFVLAAVLGTAVLGMVLAWAWGQTWDGMSPEGRTRLTSGSIEDTTAPLIQLCLAVLGVLAITGEYSTGLIRTSLTVAPRRVTVLGAKAAVAAVVALLAGLLVTLPTYFVAHSILADRGFPGYARPISAELPGLIHSSVLVMVIALVGLGLGTVFRSTAGALFTVVALLFILPIFVRFLPGPWDDRVSSVLLPNVTNPLVSAAYVVVALGAAAISIRRKDV
ncbi:ABC-type transport system involved in multi-copper enzyme maturation permease subunit [Kibdelosporangium banguiense]|uniref:ABC-type transport system involved in multi-copper enzyme maturation permease subunit n=1 Tax=Kibdelosporangium banguiense TaxID=1365924 RepID=A0ABS4THW8_9PSEU|nr:ABC transporter permease subunit [Kibdelosporangium banguiense]MBP2324033.1 ABC-type transport system involved in multi-copper enzyme maturation permease subunit [Kibdelosporangium banguiense]